MPFQRGNQLSVGGNRENAGRPKKKIVELRRKITENFSEAKKSFDLICKFRDDPNQKAELRKDCAIEILNRVLGKPAQGIYQSDESGQEIPFSIDIKIVDPNKNAIT